MYIPRLRKLDQVYKIFKEKDKNTALSKHMLEKLIFSEKITKIKYGNAWLINLDELFAFFNTKEKKNEKNDNGSNL